MVYLQKLNTIHYIFQQNQRGDWDVSDASVSDFLYIFQKHFMPSFSARSPLRLEAPTFLEKCRPPCCILHHSENMEVT